MDGDTNDPITLCLQIIWNFTCSSASQPSFKLLIQLPAVTQCNRMSTYARKTVSNWKLINFSFCPESEAQAGKLQMWILQVEKCTALWEWAFLWLWMHLWLSEKAPTAQKQCGNFSIRIFSHMLHASTTSSRRKGALMNIIVQFSVVVNNGLVVLVHWVNSMLKGKWEKPRKALSKGLLSEVLTQTEKPFCFQAFLSSQKGLLIFHPSWWDELTHTEAEKMVSVWTRFVCKEISTKNISFSTEFYEWSLFVCTG